MNTGYVFNTEKNDDIVSYNLTQHSPIYIIHITFRDHFSSFIYLPVPSFLLLIHSIHVALEAQIWIFEWKIHQAIHMLRHHYKKPLDIL